jgi:4-hydroxy-3-polyprenylbenzoate decarboxylase
VLGTGQLSLAKFLFIAADDTNQLRAHHVFDFMKYVLERINLQRDIHFHTNTTIDTLDYSGTGLNTGSKVVLAAYGAPIRELAIEVPTVLNELIQFENPKLVMPGVIAIKTKPFADYTIVKEEMKMLNYQLHDAIDQLKGVAIIVVCDDADFVAANMRNYLWVTYTRCNPSHDMHGIKESFVNKHWGCEGPLVIDARIKPHHAPPVEKDPAVEKRIDRIFAKGGSLQNIA